jgi:hypothetical protein
MIIKMKHVAMLASVIFALISCYGFEKKIVYEHKPSELFYETGIIDQKTLKPFIDNHVLFDIDINEGYKEYFVWLGLSSKTKGKELKVNKVIIRDQKSTVHEHSLNSKIVLDEKSEMNLFETSVKLFPNNISSHYLEKWAGEDGVFWVEVTYEIDGREKAMRFKIERRVEWWPIFPT